MDDLFGKSPTPDPPATDRNSPLAERMRPAHLDDVVGQEPVIGPGTPLRAAIDRGRLPSLILWGPPGCGKTTLARCLAASVEGMLLAYSAVQVGVKEIKSVMQEARRLRGAGNPVPILFLDEIHRFNKAQQDALLPSVEAGDVILIGATTENPSFQVNAALLSRCRLVVLEPLSPADILTLLRRALHQPAGLADRGVNADDAVLRRLAEGCGGDVRFAYGGLDVAVGQALASGATELTMEAVDVVLKDVHLVYDRQGDQHFDLISALQKSLRNSDAQAGIYWLARMLEAGEDPLYVARRLVRTASEDVGLADPNALVQAVAATQAVRQLGMPEGALALAQAAVYIAQAPKSNALETAYLSAAERIQAGHRDPVPMHLRNAPTRTMKQLGYGAGYQYAHDTDDGVARMECLPPSLAGEAFYRPTDRGFEHEAAARLRTAWRLAHPKSSAAEADQ